MQHMQKECKSHKFDYTYSKQSNTEVSDGILLSWKESMACIWMNIWKWLLWNILEAYTTKTEGKNL